MLYQLYACIKIEKLLQSPSTLVSLSTYWISSLFLIEFKFVIITRDNLMFLYTLFQKLKCNITYLEELYKNTTIPFNNHYSYENFPYSNLSIALLMHPWSKRLCCTSNSLQDKRQYRHQCETNTIQLSAGWTARERAQQREECCEIFNALFDIS
jgi:hypothetical protein